MAESVIETQGLLKSFKGHNALNGLDLNVPAGSTYGNSYAVTAAGAAGKTVTVYVAYGGSTASATLTIN